MKQKFQVGADGGAYPIISSASIDTPSSVMYVAAYNSSAVDKERADVVLDGDSDEVELNALIENMSSAKGGIIYLFPGDYIIDHITKVTRDDSSGDATLFGYGLIFNNNQGEVIISGVTNLHKESNVSSQSNFKGATIRLSQSAYDGIEEGEEVSLVGSRPPFKYSRGFFQLRNLGFYIPDNKKAIVVIDGKDASEIGCENIFIGTGANVASDDTTNPKCIGIRCCNSGNNGRHYALKFIKICGVGTGFHIAGEHLVCEQIIPQRCHFGYVFGNISELNNIVSVSGSYGTGQHNLTLINCCFEYVHYGIIFGESNIYQGEHILNAVTFIDLNCEEYSSGLWGLVKHCEDRGNGCFRGRMDYFCMPSKSRMWDDISNGKYFKSTNLVAPKVGGVRPTNDVEIGYQFFNTSSGRFEYRTPDGWE